MQLGIWIGLLRPIKQFHWLDQIMSIFDRFMEDCVEVKNAIFVFSRGHFPDFTAEIFLFYAHKIVKMYLNGGKSMSFSSNQTYTPI